MIDRANLFSLQDILRRNPMGPMVTPQSIQVSGQGVPISLVPSPTPDLNPQSIQVSGQMAAVNPVASPIPDRIYHPFFYPDSARSGTQSTLPEPPTVLPRVPSSSGMESLIGGKSSPQISAPTPTSSTSQTVVQHLSTAVSPQVAASASKTYPKAINPTQSHPSMQSQSRVTSSTAGDSMRNLSPLLQPAHITGNRVVVSIPDKKVVVYGPQGDVIKEYSAYVGTPKNPTPRGQFRIMENIKPAESEWYYGGHWLGFAEGFNKGETPGHGGSYAGFHGWVYDKEDEDQERVEPGWKTSTHGCIQMRNPDVAELSGLIGAGDPVSILDTPLAPPPPKYRPSINPVSPIPFLGSLLGGR